MELTPQSVRATGFKTVRKGYDPTEVGGFKDRVASAIESAQNQATAMEARARAAVAKLQELTQSGAAKEESATPAAGAAAPAQEQAPQEQAPEAAKRAEQEDVMVYGIGLAGGMGFGGRRGGYGRGGGRQQSGQPDGPDPGLRKIAAASGGGYFELTTTRDLATVFARVADELHRQYLLGFVPQKLDGKAHRLEVRVKGEGLVARARKSYVAAR
jgi:VWFA-related protein